jgi:hypothetical protein
MSSALFARKRVSSELERSVQALARGHMIRRKNAEVPSAAELLLAAIALLAHSSGATLKQYRINYDGYCTAKATCSAKVQVILSSSAFAKVS